MFYPFYVSSLRISKSVQEIISNILFYEKMFLLNGGMTTKSAEMQDLLGIQFKEVGQRYEFISKPAPRLNVIQALKVCNLVSIYKLAEVVSINNDSIKFGTILHSTPLESEPLQLPAEANFLMKKISSWPKVLEIFNTSHFFSEPSGDTEPGLASQPASLQLLHALADANGRKVAAKIHHNVLIAAAHIAYIKEHHVDGDHVSDSCLPDLPDLASLCVSSSMSFNLMHSSLVPKGLFPTSES
jgi:hypothetical protein